MSGINCEIFLDTKHISKHLPNTPQSRRLLLRGRAIHVFKDEDTMLRVIQAIMERGEYTGNVRNYERYGLFFAEAIGCRISPDGLKSSLFWLFVTCYGSIGGHKSTKSLSGKRLN